MQELHCSREEAEAREDKFEADLNRLAKEAEELLGDDFNKPVDLTNLEIECDDEGIPISPKPSPKSDIDILIEEGWCENGDGEWADDETIDNE